MIKRLLIVLLIFSFITGQSQQYVVRSISKDGSTYDTTYYRGGFPFDLYKKNIQGEYYSIGNAPVVYFYPYDRMVGSHPSLIWATITDPPSIPTNTNQLTNGASFITGINSGNVTTALGFTPANASHNHAASEVNTGTFADGRIAASNVTQHQAALTIAQSQVTNLVSNLAAKEPTITAGTSAQYLKGDKTLGTYQGYSINVQALTSSPTDAQTIYFGMLPKAPVTGAATSKVFIRKAGTIKIAEIYCYSGTAGTNESWSIYIRLNNSSETLIATVSASTSERVFSNTGLSITVAVGDYIEIKSVNPTWVTNPLTTIFSGYIYIE